MMPRMMNRINPAIVNHSILFCSLVVVFLFSHLSLFASPMTK